MNIFSSYADEKSKMNISNSREYETQTKIISSRTKIEHYEDEI